MKCSDCKRWRTSECYSNPKSVDYDNAEQFTCFNQKKGEAPIPIDADHTINKIEEHTPEVVSTKISIDRKKSGKQALLAFGLIFIVVAIFTGISVSNNWNAWKDLGKSNQENNTTSTAEFRIYRSNAHGFSILIPDTWETQTNIIDGIYWDNLISTELCKGEQITSVNVNTMTIGDLSLQYYYAQLHNYRNAYYDDYHVISEENITIDGIPAIKVIYTLVMDGETLKGMDCFLVKNQTAWAICGATFITCWNTCTDIFNTMIYSFKVLD